VSDNDYRPAYAIGVEADYARRVWVWWVKRDGTAIASGQAATPEAAYEAARSLVSRRRGAIESVQLPPVPVAQDGELDLAAPETKP
jgi:hypothetical protein